ncbi:hypothetical protein [Rhodococcus sp. OK302]|uniref:hypothetical protein n=1 Tax=Rhodococcus sp. OK302 TaxID=1882769 RepID=UPI000B944931|nr:hypothetical protein [Rhodococcus sp. OK302]OYD66708.1 hypothetical protein BDB13_0204 [Rhodococcus sp. OK302]
MRKHYRWWATAAALVVGLIFVSVQQTSARWTDSETLPGGTITAGVLDLTVGGAGSSYDFAALGGTGMFPNSYAQAPLAIRNSGSVPLNYRLQNVVQTQPDVPLTLTLSKVNAEADCPKQAAPTNATQIYTGAMSGAQVPTAPAWRTLAPNTSEVLCIRGTVGTAAEPGKSTSVAFTFAAESK